MRAPVFRVEDLAPRLELVVAIRGVRWRLRAALLTLRLACWLGRWGLRVEPHP